MAQKFVCKEWARAASRSEAERCKPSCWRLRTSRNSTPILCITQTRDVGHHPRQPERFRSTLMTKSFLSSKPEDRTRGSRRYVDPCHDVSKLWAVLLDQTQVQHMRRKQTSEDCFKPTEELVEPASSVVDTGALVLPEGVYWLHKEVAGWKSRNLFVRESSFQLCDIIEASYRGNEPGVVVTGSPGVGKSWLSNLLLMQAAQRKRNVIYESVLENVAYFFEAETGAVQSVRAPRTNFRPWQFSTDPATLYIIDGGGKGSHREPLDIAAFTVVFAAPDENNYGTFIEEAGIGSPLFMPDWTLEDLCAVLPFVQDRAKNVVASNEAVAQRFKLLGGVPRFVFGTSEDVKSTLRVVDASLKELDGFNTQILPGLDVRWILVPEYVFTLRSKYPFDYKSTVVARGSNYVEKALQGTDALMSQTHSCDEVL